MMDSRNFLSLQECNERYKAQIKPLKYFGLISALRQHYNENFPKIPRVSFPSESFFNSFTKSLKGNRVVYKKLVALKSSIPLKSQSKWNSSITSNEGSAAVWKTAYTLASMCTKSTTLVSFQYRLLLRILPTNTFLTKIGIKQDTNCSFCSNAPENYAMAMYKSQTILDKFDGKTSRETSQLFGA